MQKISFKEFIEQVEQRLNEYSPADLRQILMEWAKSTTSASRYEFLAKLQPTTASQQPVSLPNNELLEEIRELAERVENGDYCDGWGWDHEIHDERDFGDESWAAEVDEFFSRAHDALADDHYKLAENAYSQLFEILEMGEESGHLPGSLDPTSMLETDLEEARDCHLRALYLSTTLNERPTRLLEAMQKSRYHIGDNFNLQSIVNAQREPLPDFTEFLTQWIEILKTEDDDATRYLLCEAVILSGGISAIAELARRQGRNNPKAYIKWIEALEKESNFQAMLSAAKEGLEGVPKDIVIRAEIAKGLVRAGEHLGDIEAQLLGWREALYSDPSLANLLSLVSIAGQEERRREEIEAAIDRLTSLIKKEKGSESRMSWEQHDTWEAIASENLLNHVYLLAGRYEEALDLCKNEGALGWSYGHNPKSLVIPFFLMLLSKGMKQYPAQNLEQVWEQSINAACKYSCRFEDDKERIKNYYIRALGEIINSIHLSEDEEKRYLNWSIEEVGYRVDAIVGEKHRQSYNKAANLLVALAEVLTNRGMKADGDALIEKYQRKYNRHIAFQRELREAVKILEASRNKGT